MHGGPAQVAASDLPAETDDVKHDYSSETSSVSFLQDVLGNLDEVDDVVFEEEFAEITQPLEATTSTGPARPTTAAAREPLHELAVLLERYPALGGLLKIPPPPPAAAAPPPVTPSAVAGAGAAAAAARARAVTPATPCAAATQMEYGQQSSSEQSSMPSEQSSSASGENEEEEREDVTLPHPTAARTIVQHRQGQPPAPRAATHPTTTATAQASAKPSAKPSVKPSVKPSAKPTNKRRQGSDTLFQAAAPTRGKRQGAEEQMEQMEEPAKRTRKPNSKYEK